MKKWMLVLLSSFCLLSSGTSVVNAANNPQITINVNGDMITFDVEPINDHGTVLVPLRFVVDKLGGKIVSWNNNELILAKDTTTITLHIGSEIVQKNQEQFMLTTAPKLIGGRTLVPLRFLSEAFGASINYIDNNVSIGTPSAIHLSPAISGNSIGNLNNGGSNVGYEDWIYFSNHLDQGKLYKEKTDGTDQQKVSDDIYIGNLNVVNQKLYYISGNILIKSSLDGTNRELMEDFGLGGPRLMSVVGDWIYYTQGNSMFMPLYRMKTDGTSKQLLEKNEVSSIAVTDGEIYYTIYLTKLFVMDVDGSNKRKLSDTGSILNLDNKADSLFFNYNGKLYTMRTDGTSLTKVSDHDARDINIHGDWLYYSNYSEYSKKLYRINLVDHSTQKIGDDKTFYLNIIDNKIIYSNPYERITKQIPIE